ncbi:hypothetical protein PR202_ga14295 [Eleusine coracana subsp. coracana]|uniref:Uncharacterized protein n=1 Tax=Eleusine coracana subsp. coracana TaxID=191504 RepID=A0AAV5CG73_ELECO|nr:hypothetical protein PR202_ga14295 [Eleusine coracana subsp. coracana]
MVGQAASDALDNGYLAAVAEPDVSVAQCAREGWVIHFKGCTLKITEFVNLTFFTILDMASWRPRQRGFGEGSQDTEPGGGRGPGRGVRGRGGSYHQQFPQRGRGASYYQQRHGAAPQPRGAMMSQQWQATAPASGYMDHGQASSGLQPPRYHGGGRGGHETGLCSIAPELRQAMETSHEMDNVSSPEAGSPELSPRADTIEVTDQLKHLSVQDESSTGQEIVQAFPMSSSSFKFPHRPGSGSIGTRCLVKANHFFAELPDKDLHQYDVCIGLNHSRGYIKNRDPFCDGRVGEAAQEFHISLLEEDDGSGVERRQKTYKVVIKFAAKADLHRLEQFIAGRQAEAPQEALQVLDIVLRELPTARYVSFGRSFFSPDLGRRRSLGEGLESWRGFYQSIRPTQMGLSLNIDMSATAFFEPLPVIDFVAQLLNTDIYSRPLSDAERVKIKKALRGVKVEVTHRGNMRRKYRIAGLTSQATRELNFPVDQGGTMKSVVQYFQETYGYAIQHTYLPCLQVGNQQRPNYLPMEVCKIVEGQRYSKRLNQSQIRALLEETCQRPHDRERDIVQLKYNETGREKDCLPRVGQWNMMNKEYALEPVLPPMYARPDQVERALKARFHDAMNILGPQRKELDLLIGILPDNNGSLYGDLKRVCEIDLGLVSQCCCAKQVFKMNKQILANLALKINVKVGGRNTVLVDAVSRRIPLVTDKPTIIFGADVTHPHPGEDSSPSIAAVVASQDWPEVTKYAGLVSAQSHRQELIEDLYKVTHDPQRGTICGGMIRDGVSEGQFYQVLLHELDAIRKACASLEANYQPQVTFIVVQKRHHTRLFAHNHNEQNSVDRSGNILPGTVVDSKICHPTEFDFFLCSHAGIKGTSRPAHYHVLWDENNFTADALQSLTNNLCYTYARCTRSVSIVPPAYYAHLAAFRARFYTEPDSSDSCSMVSGRGAQSSSSTSRSTRAAFGGAVRPLPALKDSVKKVMFYC